MVYLLQVSQVPHQMCSIWLGQIVCSRGALFLGGSCALVWQTLGKGRPQPVISLHAPCKITLELICAIITCARAWRLVLRPQPAQPVEHGGARAHQPHGAQRQGLRAAVQRDAPHPGGARRAACSSRILGLV